MTYQCLTTTRDTTNFFNAPSQSYKPIKYFSPRKIAQKIKKLNDKKAPRNDFITAKMLKETPKKGVTITQTYNAIVRVKYFPI